MFHAQYTARRTPANRSFQFSALLLPIFVALAVVSPAVAAQLTRREREVLSFVSAGLDARAIAETMHLSPKTVGTHIENVYRKLGVHSRAQAVAHAYRRGLLNGYAPDQ